MTSKDFVNKFNEQYWDNFNAVADNQGKIKVMNITNSMKAILFDYNGKTWEFRGDGNAVMQLSVKTLEMMAEYAKGDVDEHIGLNWEN